MRGYLACSFVHVSNQMACYFPGRVAEKTGSKLRLSEPYEAAGAILIQYNLNILYASCMSMSL
jgi:hypothetical protein